MVKANWVRIGKAATLLSVAPVLLWAYASGPDPRHTGAPGDQNCTACHTGTAVNGGPGKVELQLPGGLTYTPGQKQRLTLVITDPGMRAFGFQASARPASNERNGQAGRFDVGGAGQVILCETGQMRGASCPASAPLEFIEHDSPNSTGRFEFDWTAPATDVGPVKIYFAGNAANGNFQNTGDRIYTSSVTLTPATAGGPRPAISSTGGVVNGASFTPGVVAGSWTTIFGSNFAPGLKTWDGLIGADGKFPTAIDGVSVTIDGLPAAVNFISPTQINVQAPALAQRRAGPVPVVVTTPNGTSDPVMANALPEAPALFLFTQAPTRYPAAVRSDGKLVGPPGLFAGLETIPVKPGDVVLLFGTGFGPTTPAVTPGQVFSGAAPLTNAGSLQVRIGGMTVTPGFAGLSGAGLYQFNVTVPNVPDGNQKIEMLLNGQQIQSDVVLVVKR